ncbi:hypothetical protein HPB48_010712 [Haemaphysalis longicornis]|uniref:Monocarboxylate transporter n=1 Tax=Haemaphysalis longicornis TaxID=44386 RepID=A0A9J6G7E4_HAELO|nr:hypothetical protein HPB48_010712 [Haemaphysalis longicornis]
MLCTFASQAAALAILGLVKNYWFLVASCFVSGLSAGSRIFASTIMVAELFDERALPLSLGVTNFFAGVFCLARPSLIGFARDVIGSYDPLYIAFAVTNGVFTVTWTISFFCQRCRRPREWKHVNGFAAVSVDAAEALVHFATDDDLGAAVGELVDHALSANPSAGAEVSVTVAGRRNDGPYLLIPAVEKEKQIEN